MRKYILIASLLIFSLTGFTQTKTISLQGESTSLEILSNTGLDFTASLNISEFSLSKINSPEGIFTLLSIPGFTKRFDDGHPSIPVYSSLVEYPTGATVSVTVKSYDVLEYDLNELGYFERLFPAQPSYAKNTEPEDMAFEYDEVFYQNNAFSNYKIVQVQASGDIRGTGVGSIVINPVQYNPATNILRIYQNVVFEVHFTCNTYTQYLEKKANLYSPAHQSAYSRMSNYIAPPTKDVITQYPIKYVIVADRMFESELQRFIQWKTEKGFTVIEAYTDMSAVGNTTTSIQSYLQGLYNAGTPTDPAPTYILLVGDIAEVPAFTGTTGSHVTDLYYACYGGGSDYLPDVYYGRFSASNVADLKPQIDKTLMYEQFTMPSADYMDTVVMVAGVDGSYSTVWANGQINYGTDNYFNAAHGIYSYTYLYPTSDQSWVPADIHAKIGAGVGYANYTAHCSSSGWADPSFSISDIAGLNNENKYGLIVGNCCESNKFNVTECFGEAILRAVGEGAVGYIGASNYSYWDEDYWWGVGNTSNIIANPTYAGTNLGAYDKAFHDHGEATTDWFISNGQMVQAGNISVEASTSPRKTYYWEEYHLMGDPSVMNYFSKPDPLTITYNSPLMVGDNSLLVNTEQYTYVAISLNGVLLDAQYTGTNTSVTLNFPTITAIDTALVVATKQNKIPHIGDLPIEDVLLNDDAEVFDIISPYTTYGCTGVQETPTVVIRNHGVNNLTQVNINYQIDGGTVETLPWTGNLATYEKDTVDLSAFTLSAGVFDFISYTSLPNGVADSNISNDSTGRSFTVSSTTLFADFTIDDTAFCTAPATINLTNNSTGASYYLWDFGDGNTSSVDNPSYTYNTPGSYTVLLIADAGVCGSDQASVDVLIGADPPTVSDTSNCGAMSFLLEASGTNLFWYSDSLGNTQIATGATYTTPMLSNTTTYYVCSEISNTYTGGKPDNNGTGGYFTSNYVHGLIFTCYSPVTLNSVRMYAGSAGNRTFTLKSSTGATIDQITVNVPAGESVVTLDLDIPVGTNMSLLGPTSPDLFRNGSSSGPNLYPYLIGDVIEITQSTAGSNPYSFYYYFYDWNVEQVCRSAMIPLTVSVFDVPATSFTHVKNNLTVTFTNTSTGGGNWLWDFGDGNTSTLENPVHTYAMDGTYTVILSQNNSCGSDLDTMVVTVLNTVGIEDYNNKVILYPNPAQDYCEIAAPENMDIVELFDASGRCIQRVLPATNVCRIDLSSIATGMYYVRVRSNNNMYIKSLAIE